MKDRKVLRGFVMVSQVGISMLVPIFLCALLGYWLNGIFHQEILFVVLVFLGAGAGFRNLYVITRSFYARDMKREHDRLEYIESLKKYSGEHPEEDFSQVMEGKKKRYPENNGPTRS